MLLEAWVEFEQEHGTAGTREKVQSQMPKKVKKRRKRIAEDGTDAGWEEYYDYIFPNDVSALPHLKFLEKAKLWKEKAAEAAAEAEAAQNEEGDEAEEEEGAGDEDVQPRTFSPPSSPSRT